MFNFLTAGAATGGAGGLSPIIIMVLMLGVMYLVVILPQKKKDKAAQALRNSIQIGDGVTTIGGVVGIVLQVNDDTVLVETGSDRTKLRFCKWAIQDVEKLSTDDSSPAEDEKSSK